MSAAIHVVALVAEFAQCSRDFSVDHASANDVACGTAMSADALCRRRESMPVMSSTRADQPGLDR